MNTSRTRARGQAGAVAAADAGPALTLQVKNLRKRFGERQVLEGFTLDVGRGEIVGLLGPNGCGKSTLLHIVCQVLEPDAGTVQLLGRPILTGDREGRARVGFAAQDCALYPDLLPAETLDFFARLHGLGSAARRSRVDELMQRFGLRAHAGTPAGRLSGGWRQRLHLAVALVHGPQLLVLDEPLAAVDPAARQDLAALIAGLRDGGTAILMTSHQLDEAERLCDRLALMRAGQVAAVGTLPELLARVPAQAVALVQTRDAEATRRRARALGWAVRQDGGQLACLLPQALDLRAVVRALGGPELSAASVRPVALQDLYLDLAQGATAQDTAATAE